MKIKIKKLSPDSLIPTRPDNGSAAYDLYTIESSRILPHETCLFKTGIALEIPPGYVGIIYNRSGMGKQGFDRHGGVIDSSYRGDIGVLLCNTTTEIKFIEKGARIAQIAFHKIEDIDFELTEKLSETSRNNKGFGASG